MINYISKQTIKQTQCKQIFDKAFKQVQKEARAEGLTFSCNLVGSAKRNMILENKNEGFDCDYQLFLQKNKKRLSPSEIKRLLIRLFDKYLSQNNGFTCCEDSTTAITKKRKAPTELFFLDMISLSWIAIKKPRLLSNEITADIRGANCLKKEIIHRI